MRTDFRTAVRATCLLSVCGLIGLTGCFSLSRTAPPQRHYVLGGTALQENEPPLELAGLKIGVRRLRLASYLEAPFLVVRRGAHQVGYSEFHRWGEQLDGGINRAVAGYLAAQAPFGGVDVAPWPPQEEYDYLIQLHVLRFEGLAPEEPSAVEGEVQMLATWEIIRQRDGVVLARGTTDFRQGGWRQGDYASLVAILDAGLNVLSGDLVSSLSELAVEEGVGP